MLTYWYIVPTSTESPGTFGSLKVSVSSEPNRFGTSLDSTFLIGIGIGSVGWFWFPSEATSYNRLNLRTTF